MTFVIVRTKDLAPLYCAVMNIEIAGMNPEIRARRGMVNVVLDTFPIGE